MITYKNISLFDAPRGSYMVHACNSQGVWGSGIAKEFKARYPTAFNAYRAHCEHWNSVNGTACGTSDNSWAFDDEPHAVGWIITSHNYGDLKDDLEYIKVNTTLALVDLCERIVKEHLHDDRIIEVYSNKFNSGLFGVPWKDSELILKTVLRHYKQIHWIVCDPNL
jgi:hypothetical protein